VAYLGESGLGVYYVVITAVGMIELLPAAVSQVVYPRMAEHYGRTGTLRAIVRMAVKPILLTAVGMIPVIATAWWLVEPAMRWVLPQYVDAVPAIRWGLLVPFVGSFAPVTLVFNVVRRQELYAAAILIGMAAYGGCLWWLLRGGVTLDRFPQAMLIGQVVFMLCSYAFVAYLARREADAT
jgi:O-antigen/teichoic acid export membrane protein